MLPKVLLVDDAEWVHALLSVHFQGEAFTMHSAYGGESAMEKVIKLKPDLVLLDVDMPGLDGFEVCRRLRENPFTMNIPVIFLTAASETGQKVNGLELGASDYITKPFDPTELLARVRASLRAKSRFDELSKTRVRRFLTEPIDTQTPSSSAGRSLQH